MSEAEHAKQNHKGGRARDVTIQTSPTVTHESVSTPRCGQTLYLSPAASVWRQYNMQEARGYIITAYRRRLALTSAREFARHRLHRVPYIGVPRAAIAQHRVVHGAPGLPGLGGGGPVAHQIRSTDFFAHQRSSASCS